MHPRWLHRIWHGGDPLARLLRAALMPLAAVHGGASHLRNVLYDRGVLRSVEPLLPALSIGNLTAGGTGKTPVAAEVARRLRARGARPAIVLRGYGGDEPLVHERLNPDVPVIVAPDRVAGIAAARGLGARCVVLDDAFQHRRAKRIADLVLLSADAWRGAVRPLPAGPWREPLAALRRAHVAIVTRKAAPDAGVQAVLDAVAKAAPGCPRAVVSLVPGRLETLSDAPPRPLGDLRGRRVAAIAAIGDPEAFLRQLREAGAQVEPYVFGDHHHFTPAEIARLALAAGRSDLAICTLKDAVKLTPSWPRAAPTLWYVSQAVTFEHGEAHVERVLDELAAAHDHRPHPT